MLRFDVPYENKRSSKLIKRKEFQDKEFLVESIEEGDGNRSGQAGFVCVRERGTNKKFKAGIKAAKPVRLELLQNAYKYVGGEVTVRYNGRTPSGVPRFPRAIAWYPEGRDV
jgi:ATP-dependent DNA ligase